MTRARPDAVERARLGEGLGALLFRERLITGMSVDDVARLAGLSSPTCWRIEAGSARPSSMSLLRLARALRPRHDREGAAALFAELEAAGGASVYRSPHWRPRARWRRLIAEARAERELAGKAAQEAAERGQEVPRPPVRAGGGTSPLAARGGPLDLSGAPARAGGR